MATVIVDSSKTYYADGSGTVFQFAGDGWNAVLEGTSSLDCLDFSQYTDAEYGCNFSQDGQNLVIEVVRYYGDQVEQQTHIGTVTVQGYFNSSNRISNLKRWDYEDGQPLEIVEAKLIVGGNYNVDVNGTSGIDFIVTGNGNKTVNAGDSWDVIQVGWGDAGAEGVQTVNAGAGDDEIYADGGQNILNGDEGDDDIFVENTNNNTLNGGAGNDRLEVYGTGHTLNGGVGNDVLVTHGSGNTLNGGSGNDEITICEGTHVVDGGTGNDTLFIHSASNHNIKGGEGSDVFEFNTFFGSNTVMTIDQSVFNQGDADVLKFNHYTKGVFTYALDNGELSIIHSNGGKLKIKGWDVNPLSKIIFVDGQEITGNEVTAMANGVSFNVVTLNDNDYYSGGANVHEEFAIDFSDSTNITIDSTSGVEDRIRFTNNWTMDNTDINIRDNDLYINTWNNDTGQAGTGTIIIKDYMNSTVKTLLFAEQNYHLVTGGDSSYVSSDTERERYVFLDRSKDGTDPNVGDWSVTIDGAGTGKGNIIDLSYLPNNRNYYGMYDTRDGQDMVLTYKYCVTPDGDQETLGTIRLKNFFNADGTVNEANANFRIRTNRWYYSGNVSPDAFDGLVWNKVNGSDKDYKNCRWLDLEVGTSGADEVELDDVPISREGGGIW